MLNVYSMNISMNLYTRKKKINAIYLSYAQLHTPYLHAKGQYRNILSFLACKN